MLKFCPYFMQRIRSLEAKCISLEKKVRLFTGKEGKKKRCLLTWFCFAMFHFMNLSNLIKKKKKKFVECCFEQ